MNKYILSLAAFCLTLGFTACEDVPAPYQVNNTPDNNNGGNDNNGNEKTIFAASFNNGTDGFEFKNVSLSGSVTYVWKQDSYNNNGYLKASAFANSTKNATEAWAISPAINLADCTKAALNFRHVVNKVDGGVPAEMYTLWAATEFTGNVATTNWTKLEIPSYPAGTDWSYIDAGNIDLTQFCGQSNVRIAFKYTSTEASAGTWQIDEFTITGNGTPMNNGGNDNPPATEGKNLLTNGGFETWNDGICEGWVSTTSASSANVTSQSTEAHSGTSAILLKGNEKQNKRLASKEYTLKAGNYTMKFFVKGKGQVCPGYVPVTNGSVGSYVYGKYTPTTDEWTEVSHNFTLETTTTLNLVVMNPKTSSYAAASDKLIDDFSLTTTDGGLVEGGTTTPSEPSDPSKPSTPTESIFSESFENNQGAFTIDDKMLPEGSTYVWSHNTNIVRCMKASAYVGGSSKAAESWLISPEIDLSKANNATLTYQQAGHFFGSMANFTNACTVKVKVVGTNTWNKLSVNSAETGSSWTLVAASANLSAYAGKKIQIAFCYTSTNEKAGTWEVKDLVIK